MKKLLLLAAIAGCSGFIHAQGTVPAAKQSEFKELQKGILWKKVRNGTVAGKPSEGDVLRLYVSYYRHRKGSNTDSLLFSSMNNPRDKALTIGLPKPAFQSDVIAGLYQMQAGDSAQFIVAADSFLLMSAGYRELPEHYKAGDEILFCAGLIDITPKAVAEEARKKEQEKQLAEMQQKAEAEKALMQAYLAEKGITTAPQASGLIYVQKSPGAGEKPKKGQRVTVHYSGYLLNGNKFDSSVDRGEPFVFELGRGQVIAGWDEGIALMQPGEKAQLIIPSNLGYGSRNMGPIPANSTLVFDVELIKAD